ncbi:MAG TPA: hypothetical protein PK014_00815 [Thermoanaerobaculia bacterium]|nr:hypothetical protein [Thermoanaerobaculia bacterium]HUM29710.1 hypothetical protein [Thermoanaerobaculia bacterium]HXK67010.1 hypothetical protein [Thermoanaerobaculia bacterium]
MEGFKPHFPHTLLLWSGILTVAVIFVFLSRATAPRMAPYTGGATLIWREGKVPTGTPEILTFEKTFTLQDPIPPMTLYVHAFPSYLLYLDDTRIGGGWDQDDIYVLDPILSSGTHILRVVIPSPDGFGYLLCNPHPAGWRGEELRSGRSWTVSSSEGPLGIRTLGVPPLPYLTDISRPGEKPLFPTYAGGPVLNPVTTERRGNRTLYDFGSATFGYPEIRTSDPFRLSWGETLEAALAQPPLETGPFPELSHWTTPEACWVRYVILEGTGKVEPRLRPVTGPYPL